MKRTASLEIENGKVVFEKFPLVYKHDNGVTIIYSDHSEYYKFDSVYKGEVGFPYNADNEVSMCEGNNCKKVHHSVKYES